MGTQTYLCPLPSLPGQCHPQTHRVLEPEQCAIITQSILIILEMRSRAQKQNGSIPQVDIGVGGWGVCGSCLWPFSQNQNWHYVACGPDPAQWHSLIFIFIFFIFCWVLAMKVYIIEINFKHPYFYFLSKNKSEGIATRGLLSAAIEVLQPPSDRMSALQFSLSQLPSPLCDSFHSFPCLAQEGI